MFIPISELEKPLVNVSQDILFKRSPFYQDFYVVIHIKSLFVPESKFKPVIINDPELRETFLPQCLGQMTSTIEKEAEWIYSAKHRARYCLAKLVNQYWCIYIDKKYLWDYFSSTGVITIFCCNRNALLDFFSQHFELEKCKKSTFTAKNIQLLPTTSINDLY